MGVEERSEESSIAPSAGNEKRWEPCPDDCRLVEVEGTASWTILEFATIVAGP